MDSTSPASPTPASPQPLSGNQAIAPSGTEPAKDSLKARFTPLLGNLDEAEPKEPIVKSKPAEGIDPKPARRTSYMVAGVRRADVNVTSATAPMEKPSKAPIYGAWAAITALSVFSLWQYQRTAQLSDRTFLSSSVLPSGSENLSGLFGQIEAAKQEANKQYQDVLAQFSAATKRLEESEKLNQQLESQVKELLTQVNLSAHLNQVTTGNTEGLQSSNINVADLTPGHRELLLVKERNRITAFADTAIATGEREPYDRLWVIFENPQLASLAHAARSEILRVQNFYLSGSRISRYDIAVGNYFPDQANLKDHQLNEAQLIHLLEKKDAPWQVRLKAAHLLGRIKSINGASALVKAVKEDTNLDVVKEATFSFEQITGYRARIFEVNELAAWWEEYKKLGRSPSSVSESKPAAAESKPAAAESKPAAAESKPAAAESKPAAAESKPAAAESKPAAAESKPAAAESKPAAAESKPAAKPEQKKA